MDRATRLGWAAAAGVLAAVAMAFLPLAGFTERTAYAPGPIVRDYAITGIGTYGEDFNLFTYPAGTWWVQLAALALAAGAAVAAIRCLRLRSGGTGGARRTARLVAGSAVVLVVAAVVLFAAVFPSVEERTIWMVESAGFLDAWWPDYGLFVAAGALGVMAWLLVSAEAAAPAAPPPAEPAPPPTEP
jgi:hypothetical protein